MRSFSFSFILCLLSCVINFLFWVGKEKGDEREPPPRIPFDVLIFLCGFVFIRIKNCVYHRSKTPPLFFVWGIFVLIFLGDIPTILAQDGDFRLGEFLIFFFFLPFLFSFSFFVFFLFLSKGLVQASMAPLKTNINTKSEVCFCYYRYYCYCCYCYV